MQEQEAQLLNIVNYEPGEFLFHENEPGHFFLIIQQGEVEVFRTSRDQKKVPLAIVGSGQSLGEFAAIDKKPRSASAQALTSVEAVKISEEAYHQLLSELPEWASCVLTSLVERLRQTNDIVRRYGIVDEKLMVEIESINPKAGQGSGGPKE